MREYSYIRFNDRYFCLQQNLATLAWVLFLKKSSLDLVFSAYPIKVSNKIKFYIRRKWRAFRRDFSIYIPIIRCKYFCQKSKEMLSLPVYGQICKATHRGYKIFDFRRKVVTKIFDSTVEKNTFIKEVEKLKLVSQLGFAPSLKKWNIEERWYEEDYIDGSLDVDHSYMPVGDSVAIVRRFKQSITPFIEKMIMFQSPKRVKVCSYIDSLTESFLESELHTERSDKVDNNEIDEVKTFFNSMIKHLKKKHNSMAYLVYSHGDFCSANILNTKKSIKIIDWEHVTNRSALFDFYSYFFFRPYRDKISVNELFFEINEALPSFISRLSIMFPEMAQNISFFDQMYRFLYYIERIVMLVERERTDRNLDIRKTINKFIDVFSSYEEATVSY